MNVIGKIEPAVDDRASSSTATLSGTRIRNYVGEDLGEIEDIIVDRATGRITHAIVSFGGFLGLGEKRFPVPWHALTWDEDGRTLLLDLDADCADQAPGFFHDGWPDLADRTWTTRLNAFYGVPAHRHAVRGSMG